MEHLNELRYNAGHIGQRAEITDAVVITLDGECQRFVQFADVETGRLIRHRTQENGEPHTPSTTRGLLTEELHGVVEIRLPVESLSDH